MNHHSRLPLVALALAAAASIATSPPEEPEPREESAFVEIGAFELTADDKPTRRTIEIRIGNPSEVERVDVAVEFTGEWDGEGEPAPLILRAGHPIEVDVDLFEADFFVEHTVDFTDAGVQRTEAPLVDQIYCGSASPPPCVQRLVVEFETEGPGVTTLAAHVFATAFVEPSSELDANLFVELVEDEE